MAQVPASPSSPALGQPVSTATVLAARLRSGAGWFLWIGVMSVINSLVYWFGGKISFIVGLGITQVIDAIATSGAGGGAGSPAMGLALLLDIMAAGVFVLFWKFAKKGAVGPFVLGMVLYAVDGVIFLVVKDFIPFGFHLFALYCLFQGYRAAKQIQETAHLAPPPIVTPQPLG